MAGTIAHDFIHEGPQFLDIYVVFAGLVFHVAAMGGVSRAVYVYVSAKREDRRNAQWFANGAIARMHWSSVAGFMPGPEAWLYGADGTLRLELLGRDNVRLSGGRRGDKEMKEIQIPADKTYRWRVEEEFIGAIRGQEQVRRTSFVDAVNYMDFTEAVHISSREGRRVHLPLA